MVAEIWASVMSSFVDQLVALKMVDLRKFIKRTMRHAEDYTGRVLLDKTETRKCVTTLSYLSGRDYYLRP